MILQALLYTDDAEFLSVFNQGLAELQIEYLEVGDPLRFLDLLEHENFDLLVVDCEPTEHGLELVDQARQRSANRDIVLMVATTARDPEGFLERGANVILYKPLTAKALERHLRNAYPLMLTERRRYSRYPVQIPVAMRTPEGRQVLATGYSLSEGGIALQCPERLDTREVLNVEFVLPEEDTAMQLSGKLAWVNTDLHTGIRFVRLTVEARDQLKGWLDRHAPPASA